MFKLLLNKYPFFSRLALLFLPLLILFNSGTFYFLLSEVKSLLYEIKFTERQELKQGVFTLEHNILMTFSDLQFLSRQFGLLEMITDSADENHGHSILHKHKHVTEDWLVFSRTKPIYDQIRWLDINGLERDRVNYNNGEPYNVQQKDLQNKAGRYYFSEAIRLNRNEIFISPLDLNIENGKIEQPVKPVIRIGTPIYDDSGNKQGVILLNILAESLISSYESVVGNYGGDHAWLLNSESYWLKGPSPDLEWGFMYQREKASMAYMYPESWEKIKSSNSGQFFDDNGLWTYETVYPLIEGQKPGNGLITALKTSRSDFEAHQYRWKAVLFLPEKTYRSQIWSRITGILVEFVFVLAVLFIGCWQLARLWVKHLNAQEEILRVSAGLEKKVNERTQEIKEARILAEKQARTDELTGMRNRRAFFEFGQQVSFQADRYQHKYSIIMLDIDHFKNFNDNYGHSVGDKILKVVANAIDEQIREVDFAARIGGEEFAIILPETDSQKSLQLAERIRVFIKDIVVEEDGNYLSITISMGVAELPDNKCSIDKVLDMSDVALYQAKENGRNQVVLYKPTT